MRSLTRKLVCAPVECIHRELVSTQFEQDRWAVSLLDIQPDDQVLEIDCRSGGAPDQGAHDVPLFPLPVGDSVTVKRRRVQTHIGASVQALRLLLQPGRIGPLPFRDDQFDKAVLFTLGQRTLQPKMLHEVRRVLTQDCRLAVVQWPVAIGMYDVSFRPEYDDLVQRYADGLKIGLKDAGFGQVRLHFKPTDPISTLCAVAESRTAARPYISSPVLSGFWW